MPPIHYTIAQLVAEPPEGSLQAGNPEAPTFAVGLTIYGIYALDTEGVDRFSISSVDDEGVLLGPIIAAAEQTLVAGTEMIAVERDLINLLRDKINPPPPPEPYYMTRVTSLQFLGLFTPEETAAIYAAAQGSIEIQVWKDQAIAADYVDLTDPRIIDGLAGLVAEALVTQDRVDAILQGVLVE